MTAPHTNRFMFRRLVRRLLFANRGRLFVILLALSAGATVSAALLNLQTDAKRRITSEFRAFGANVVIMPRLSIVTSATPPTLDAALVALIPSKNGDDLVAKAALLPMIAKIFPWDEHRGLADSSRVVTATVVGYDVYGDILDVIPGTSLEGTLGGYYDGSYCVAGKVAAEHLHIRAGNFIRVGDADKGICQVVRIDSFGGAEDDKIFASIRMVQQLTGLTGRAGSIQVSVPGTPQQILDYVLNLQKKFPDLEVRPLRQFTEAQAKIYSRISSLFTAATALILILTGLCVMAAMTNIAAERKQDVGMMKAIGGSARGILNLFLTEAALLGLAGGLIGAAAGIALSMALGKAIFGIAAAPRFIVYPISVTLTVIVAILGAYPLRRLANVRPATIFRGDA